MRELLAGLSALLTFGVCDLVMGVVDGPIATRGNALSIWEVPTDGRAIALRPNTRHYVQTSEFFMDVSINADGIRNGAHESSILVMGDSFAFGYGVRPGDPFADLLGAVNVGYADGFSPVDYAVALPIFYARYRPSTVIVTVFPENDLVYDVTHREIIRDTAGDIVAVRLKDLSVLDGALVTGTPSATMHVKQALWNHSALYRRVEAGRHAASTLPAGFVHVADVDLTVTLDALAQMQRFATAHDIRFVVFLIPSKFQVSDHYADLGYVLSDEDRATVRRLREPHTQIARWLEARDIEVINAMDVFRTAEQHGHRCYFEHDGHWTAFGHKLAADLIRAHLAGKGDA